MCWRKWITICCFLTMPIHDHRLGTGGVCEMGTDWCREIGAIGVSQRDKAGTLNRSNWSNGEGSNERN